MTNKTRRIEKGDWRVTAFCCSSGNCTTCRGEHDLTRRHRLLVNDRVSREYAEYVAGNWSTYGGKAERMTDAALNTDAAPELGALLQLPK